MIKVVHCKKEKYDCYIGRPSKFGNIFSHKEGTLAKFKVSSRDEAVDKYEKWLLTQPSLIEDAQKELKNKILGCFCAPLRCHGDVLIKYANSTTLYRSVGDKELELIKQSNEPQIVGSSKHQKYWIPSEKVIDFNNNMIGKIHIIYNIEHKNE